MTPHETKQRGDKFVLLMQMNDIRLRRYFSSSRALESYALFATDIYKTLCLRALKLRRRRWVELFRA